MSDADRIEQLEKLVRGLARDVDALRAELRRDVENIASAADAAAAAAEPASGLESAPDVGRWSRWTRNSQPQPPRAPVPRTPGRRRTDWRPALDLESLVGRYGTMALAALTIVMGVGAFLRWAIENITLGPAARVGLGALVAGIVAAGGWRLRTRGARPFGNTLLGIALALVHVDAWGAGPYLHVISPAAALAIAAVASAALAALAFSEGEQALFTVGIGGALLAPFVTSTGTESVLVLLGFGWVVLAMGFLALRGRRWVVARQLMITGGAAYVSAALWWKRIGAWWLTRDAAPLFALAIGATALALTGAEHRRRMVRAHVITLVLALFVLDVRTIPPAEMIAMAAAGTALLYAVLLMDGAGERAVGDATILEAPARRAHSLDDAYDGWTLLDTVAVPLGLFLAALFAIDGAFTERGAALALAWSAAALVMAVIAGDARRAPHLMLAATLSALAIVLRFSTQPVWCVIALSAHASVVSLVMRRERMPLLGAPAVAVLTLAAGWAFVQLHDRPIYAYTPFLTRASAGAAAAVAGWCVFSWQVAGSREWSAKQQDTRTLLVSLGAVLAFLWGREELARAYSRDIATFLLIFYFAVVGVLTIFVGRRRSLPLARRVGLVIAVYAALKAIVQATDLSPVGLRVVSYLLVGCFLLAVAYWYRAAGEGGEVVGVVGD